jgi:hypothetical protein
MRFEKIEYLSVLSPHIIAYVNTPDHTWQVGEVRTFFEVVPSPEIRVQTTSNFQFF